MTTRGWIGVDLDGTLAEYNGWQGIEHIGTPVPRMLARVKEWIREGKDVRILTARVAHDSTSKRILETQFAMIHIMDWIARQVGTDLPITCVKDFGMVELWDDRAIQVIANTGLRADGGDIPEATP